MADILINIPCPTCGRNFKMSLERLQSDPSVTCSGCGGEFEVKIQDEHGLEMTTKFGPVQVRYGARGSVSYSVEVYHQGLNKHRLIRGPDAQVVDAKMVHQAAEWNALWAKRVAAKRQMTRAERRREEATDRASEAQRTLQGLREVLSSFLSESKEVVWETLKDQTPFPTPAPVSPKPPLRPVPDVIPDAPSRTSPEYQPKFGILDKVIKSRRARKESWKAKIFELDTTKWEAKRDRLAADHAAKLEAYNRELAHLESAHTLAVEQWEAERGAFLAKQRQQHDAMDAFRARYEGKSEHRSRTTARWF